ncbi:MAG TPA: hypothetical protein VGN56_01265, partial [Candidatus Paceibacterota bacterium]|nr:hypothetical protein [Candidatus Paceibacterota bacterium]
MMKYLSPLLFLLMASMPFAASAATFPPYCSVLTKTADGEFWPMIHNKLYLIATAGEPITIIWGSANATSAYTGQNTPIGFTGQQVVVPAQTTAYAYHFDSGSQQATCTVTAVVLGSVGVAQGSATSPTPPTTNTTTVASPLPAPAMATTVPASNSTPSTASFSVSEIPLLSGGYAAPGASVPVEYLKLVNTSSFPTT